MDLNFDTWNENKKEKESFEKLKRMILTPQGFDLFIFP
jgi:hypothetical protein